MLCKHFTTEVHPEHYYFLRDGDTVSVCSPGWPRTHDPPALVFFFLIFLSLNSLPPSISFISTSLHSQNRFNRSHFSIFVHSYIFPPYLPFYTLSSCPSPSHWCQHPERTCFTLLFSIFEKRHLFKISIQGVTL
jgi:hypothetical protein